MWEAALYFLIDYAPYWAVPLFIISCQFAHLYYLKGLRHAAILFACIAAFSFLVNIFYFFAGGSGGAAVRTFRDVIEGF